MPSPLRSRRLRLPDLSGRLPALGIVLVLGAAAVYLAARTGGTAAAAGALVATAGALALLFSSEAAIDADLAARMLDGAVFALPAFLTVYLAFESGGYAADATAVATIAVCLVLLMRVTLIDAPFAGFGWPLGIAAAGLSLFALWTLLSATWSDAPGRALVEFNRALLYLLALVLFGSLPRSSNGLRWMARGLLLGIMGVAVVALATRVAPDVFPTAPIFGNERLSYPLTYSNALGILGAVGTVLCLHTAASLHEPLVVRLLAAAAMPVLATTVFLTLGRAAIAAGIIGLVTYVVLGRPRGLGPALVAMVPSTVVAVSIADDADLLFTKDPTTAAAVAQGHHLAAAVMICAGAAAGVRLLLSPLDARFKRFLLPRRLRRPVARFAWVAFIAVTVALALASGAPGWLATKYDGFVHTPVSKKAGKGVSARLADPANAGRLDNWKVALRGFHAAELHGVGAGTFELLWRKERPASLSFHDVRDAHSLYVEVLGELGAVGLLLLLTALGAILVSLAPVGRGHNRSLYAALFAAALTWAVHAGLDWDWEMPATTVWVFAVGGAALAARHGKGLAGRPPEWGRLVLASLLVAVAVVPGLMFVSQRRLDESVEAFERGDCAVAMRSAAASISTLGIRPEPYEAMAYCHERRGSHRQAVRAIDEAVERDPDNWKFRYGRALVRGAAGFDPRPDARAAKRLNPHYRLTKELVRVLERETARQRRRLTTELARIEGLYVVR